jgi:hypothetical protein
MPTDLAVQAPGEGARRQDTGCHLTQSLQGARVAGAFAPFPPLDAAALALDHYTGEHLQDRQRP